MSLQFSSILRAAFNYNQMEKANEVLQRQLTTGKKFSSPADNPSLFTRISRFQREASGYSAYISNIDEGNTVMSIVTDAASRQLSFLQKMLELAQNASNSNQNDRDTYNTEYQKLYSELDPIVNNATFNSQKLLDGTYAATGLMIATGPGQTYELKIANTTASGLGLSTSGSISSKNAATTAAANIQNAIVMLTNAQTGFGTDGFILSSRSSIMESKQTELNALVEKYQHVDLVQVSAQLDQNKLIQQYTLAVIASITQSQRDMVKYLFSNV
ncbi:flagellin [Paenibacillus hamazuiensis]|uniref:flagellin n=1 Tax=Paenibacillus hamazuiensis TaxID=2936508 RepID=UPI00200EA9AE|nr:flagellin [Paenibacillus hamazuiensis]